MKIRQLRKVAAFFVFSDFDESWTAESNFGAGFVRPGKQSSDCHMAVIAAVP